MSLPPDDSDRRAPPDALASPRLIVIADDLTGACDAAVAFTSVSDQVRVHLDATDLSQPGIHALTTNTRDLPPAAAASHIPALAANLPLSSEHFKKIDSVLRGNTFTEIAASVRAFPAELAILAPAYPALRRTVQDGVLRIDGAAPGMDLAPQLRELGCNPLTLSANTDAALLAPQIQQALTTQQNLLLCDASTQLHLDIIVRAARSLHLRTLWIGSGGLAHALASHLPPLSPAPRPQITPGHILFFIGSDHPVTRAQVKHLRRVTGIASSLCDGHAPTAGDHLFFLWRNTTADSIQRATAHLRPHDIGGLFLTGGDTALLVCNALGITSLKLQAEFAPGVPLARAEGGRFHGVSVILKSGGFGERALLCRVLDAFAGQETASAT